MYEMTENLQDILKVITDRVDLEEGKSVKVVGNEIRVKSQQREGLIHDMAGTCYGIDVERQKPDAVELRKANQIVTDILQQFRNGGGDSIFRKCHLFSHGYTPDMDIDQAALRDTRKLMKKVISDRVIKVAKAQNLLKKVSPMALEYALNDINPRYLDREVIIYTLSHDQLGDEEDMIFVVTTIGHRNRRDSLDNLQWMLHHGICKTQGVTWTIRDNLGSVPVKLTI